MATQSQYDRFAQLLVTLAILVGMTIVACGVGLGTLVVWIAPDVGTGARQVHIDHVDSSVILANAIGPCWNDRPFAG